ncbi:hypothetical protein UlMin_012650 [Ulmus minor]
MSLESILKAFISKTETHIQNQGVALRNLENQVGQLASALSSRPSGSLPSSIETPKPNGKEHCKAIQLRSGKEITSSVGKDDGKIVSKTKDKVPKEESQEGEDKVQKLSPGTTASSLASAVEQTFPKLIPDRPPPPFPQRLRKANQDKQFGKFLEILKQLHINIPLVEALQQMPNYVKFMKDVLTNKRRLGEFETVALTKEYSLLLKTKIPSKLKDPGSFTIPCSIGNTYCGRALCDLGASINLMPMSIFKQLGIG